MTATLARKKKLLAKLAVARSDIAAATSACDLLLEQRPGLGDPIYLALSNALVISYGRPFSSNRPLGPLPARWCRFENARHKDLHDQLIDVRNRAVAHSDALVRKVLYIPRGARYSKGGPRSEGSGVAVRNALYPLDVIAEIRSVCFDLGSRLNVSVERLVDEIWPPGFYAPEPIEIDVSHPDG